MTADTEIFSCFFVFLALTGTAEKNNKMRAMKKKGRVKKKNNKRTKKIRNLKFFKKMI